MVRRLSLDSHYLDAFFLFLLSLTTFSSLGIRNQKEKRNREMKIREEKEGLEGDSCENYNEKSMES